MMFVYVNASQEKSFLQIIITQVMVERYGILIPVEENSWTNNKVKTAIIYPELMHKSGGHLLRSYRNLVYFCKMDNLYSMTRTQCDPGFCWHLMLRLSDHWPPDGVTPRGRTRTGCTVTSEHSPDTLLEINAIIRHIEIINIHSNKDVLMQFK